MRYEQQRRTCLHSTAAARAHATSLFMVHLLYNTFARREATLEY